MEPLISCIMSNYNTEPAILARALDSVLNQTFCDFELLLIDDKSTDDASRRVIETYAQRDTRIIPIYNEVNKGLATSLNVGLKSARGKYVARFDTDDICEIDRFEKQYRYMEREKCDLSSSFVRLFGSEARVISTPFIKNTQVGAELLFSCYIYHPSVMIRRGFLEENGLEYDSKFEKAEDFDLWVRLRDCGGVISTIPRVLLNYRMHAKSVCHTQKIDQGELAVKICKRQLKTMGIEFSNDEFNSHLILCGKRPYTLERQHELSDWCKKLVNQNNEHAYFDRHAFIQVIYNRFFTAVMKSKLSFGRKLKCILKQRELLNWTNAYGILYKRIFGFFYCIKGSRLIDGSNSK